MKATPNLTAALAGLDFDLTPYGPQGTIAVPSTRRMRRSLKAFRRAVRRAGADRVRALTASPETLADELDELVARGPLGGRRDRAIEDLLTACVEFTAGHPGRADLERLPLPLQHAFGGWVLGQLEARYSRPWRLR